MASKFKIANGGLMFRNATLCLFIIFSVGCSTYATTRYATNVDNITAIKSLNGKTINVGSFTSSQQGQKELMCRGVGPIKTPDGEPFSEFIRKALVNDLKIADAFSTNAPITLTGNLNSIDFSSASGSWNLSLTVQSSNGKSMTVNENYSYTTSFYGETACNQTAQALMPAVQNLIGKVVQSPDFKLLIAGTNETASDETPTKPDANTSSEKKYSSSSSNSSEVNGFRDLKWGDKIEDIKGLQLVKTDKDTKAYIRQGDDLKIGDADLKGIIYHFWNGKFCSVMIEFEGFSNFEAIRKASFIKFGEGKKTNRFMEDYIWINHPKSNIALKYSEVGKEGYLYFASAEITKEITASKNTKAKEGATTGF